jgi:hypothetical protein
MTNQHRKQLQNLMSDPQWEAFEVCFQEFLQQHFVQNSIKRQSQFETIWQAAESEGAKRYLINFKNQLELEAHKV